MHMPGEFYDYSWVFHFWYCSRKGARLAEERKKERTKKIYEHWIFTVRYYRFVT